MVSPKAKAWVSGRVDWRKKLEEWRQSIQTTKDSEVLIIWMHCASLGEFEQGRPVLEKIQERHPAAKLALSFYSPSGYLQKKDDPVADYICYLPTDNPANARDWLDLLQPDLAIFVKYEFWLYHLSALQQKNIPTALIAAHFRPNQHFFRWYGGAFRQRLQQIDYIFTQTRESVQLLKTIGANNAVTMGDTRIDRVLTIANGTYEFPKIAAFANGQKLFIAGSSWPPDENLIFEDIKNWPSGWKILIAPHEIGATHINQITAKLQENQTAFVCYSDLKNQTTIPKVQVLILDTIGMLSRVYRYGDLAYIGGGFGSGIHNTLEPVAHGLPVIFGPKYHKFPEATQLIKNGVGFSVTNKEEFLQVLHTLNSEETLSDCKQKATIFVAENQGASDKIIEVLEQNRAFTKAR